MAGPPPFAHMIRTKNIRNAKESHGNHLTLTEQWLIVIESGGRQHHVVVVVVVILVVVNVADPAAVTIYTHTHVSHDRIY